MKVIQIAANPDSLYALTDDGQIYICLSDNIGREYWQRVKLPGEKSEAAAARSETADDEASRLQRGTK